MVMGNFQLLLLGILAIVGHDQVNVGDVIFAVAASYTYVRWLPFSLANNTYGLKKSSNGFIW